MSKTFNEAQQELNAAFARLWDDITATLGIPQLVAWMARKITKGDNK